jgi:uncharacterized protein (TIGR03083 family)
MTLSLERSLEAIEAHSRGLADSAHGNLDAEVEYCPGWSVADLVWHVTEVHWFWGTIVGERLQQPPEEARRPARGADDRLVDDFLAGAKRLVDTLRDADQSARVWTWSSQKDVAFVSRHQVQEAAVHHWDAAFAAAQDLVLEPDVAVDSVEEFLTFSMASGEDPAEPGTPPLGQDLVLRATDADAAWSIRDAEPEAALSFGPGAEPGAAVVSGTASDLLLWLYGRTELPVAPTDDEGLVARFRRLCFTD